MSVNKNRKSHPVIAATAIAGFFLIFGLVTLDDFGVTWDEPLHFRAGDLYLERIFVPEKPFVISEEDFEEDIQYYGPLFDIWGAFNNRLFSNRLGLLQEENARHLHLLLAGVLTIFFTVFFASEAISPRVGIYSGLFLAAYPRFVGHCFNNPKDIPLALIFVLCLFLFHRRMSAGKKTYSFLLLLAGAVGFATRIQYLLVPVVIILGVIVYNSIGRKSFRSFWGRIADFWDIPLALLLTIPLGMLFWPYFWSAPLEKFQALIDFYLHHRVQAQLLVRYLGEDYIPGLTLPWHYASVMLMITTPLFTLASLLLGLGAMITALLGKSGENKRKFSFSLVLIWIVIGLLPFMLPGQRVYGGIRHFLFVVPALCITAGIGLEFLFTRIRIRRRYLVRIATILLFVLLFISTYSYHPYYTTYYNALVGGPRGAFERFSMENWGNAYKEACRWLNRNAPEGSTVLALVAEQIPRWYLRPDITVLGPQDAHLSTDHYDYSIYILRNIDPLLLPDKPPIFQIKIKSQPICNIHHWPKKGAGH